MEGPVMASTDQFEIVVEGSGGHGAAPHQAIDSIVAASHIVAALQTIVSRRIDPIDPAVISVGSFHAGNVFNVIPGEAVLTGTVRALSEPVRERLQSELEALVVSEATAFGARAKINYRRGNPALVNDANIARALGEGAAAAVGNDHMITAPLLLGGEDFAYYAQKAPSAFALVGTRNAAVESTFPHHHPRFTIDENTLRDGVRIFLATLEKMIQDSRAGGRTTASA